MPALGNRPKGLVHGSSKTIERRAKMPVEMIRVFFGQPYSER